MGLITFKTFDFPFEAHILKSKLESEGITSFIFDENIIGLNTLYSQAMGGIKVKIRESDFTKAQNIYGNNISELKLEEESNVLVCNECGGNDFYNNFKSIKSLRAVLSILVSFVSSTYPIYQKNVYKCKNCGYELSQ